MIEASVNNSILFTAPVTINEASFMQVKNDTAQKVGNNGSVLFEVIERVANGTMINSWLFLSKYLI
jgi:hypothetical protein